jgi:4-alpha-glucanotransferase
MVLPFRLDRRAAGILLAATSLPGPHGTGDLGQGARAVADFLAEAGQRWWQMLPVNPAGTGNSPYSGSSAFAGDPMLISLRDLVDDGLLTAREVADELPAARTDHAAARALRDAALRRAVARFRPGRDYERFEREAAGWLDAFAAFEALRAAHAGAAWTAWPDDVRDRGPAALARVARELAPEIARVKVVQYLFAQQWARLRVYCRERGVGLIGDIPIFVAHDSADVWSHRSLFALDPAGEPTRVAGVPPDYFSATGQRWGNPLYRWRRMAANRYAWWTDRFRVLLERFDVVRLDHFIGFVRYWEIEASQTTAEHGRWMRGPGSALFEATRRELGDLPFIAEDLGEVTPAVRSLRDQLGLPGMRIFQFGFGGDKQASEFLPHRYPPRSVAYTGTHDNDTLQGWLDADGGAGAPSADERQAAIEYLGGPGVRTLPRPFPREALRALYASTADTVIAPMQDVLGLGSDARMNTPGRADGNWTWRVPASALSPALARDLRAMARVYGRLAGAY